MKLGTLKDTINDDDTISVSTYTCAQRFAGTYNVGKGGLYNSVGEFLDRLMLCGMSGPVTVNMLPGTYRENVILTAIPGSSKTNTLTFTSSTGDSSDVEWEREDDAYATQTSTLAAPLVLDGASHIVIKNITLSGMAPNTTGGYYYSHGISITGSSQDDNE